nr:uncharacterized mitochondrial protein AtMg00810-like [Tanacetum cinerariifolium]
KNEFKAHGTLLMALLDKHKLMFNIHKDAKTLMEAIDKSLKIYEAKVKSSSSASTSTQNIAFVSSQNTDSTNEPVSAVASVSAGSAKIQVSTHSNVDTLNDDDLEEMDLKWQMGMLTVRARRFLQRTGRNLKANGLTSMGFNMSKVECYNCYRKGHFARYYDWSFQAEEEPTNYALMAFTSSSSSSSNNEVASSSKAYIKAYATLQSYYDKLTNDLRKSQFYVISYKTRLESVEARLLVYQQNETVFEEDIKLLKLDVQLRDNALVVLRHKFEKTKQEGDELQLKLENSETDESLPASPIYARYQSSEGYRAVPPPYTGTFMPPKPDFVFHDAPNNAPSFVQPTEQVKPPRPSFKPVKNSIPAANHKTDISKPQANGNSRNRKACLVCKSLTYLIKEYDYYEKKMVQTPARHHAKRGNTQHYAIMSLQNSQRHVVPTTVLTKSKLVPLTATRPVTTAVPQPHVTRPRPAKTVVTKSHSAQRRNINRRPSPKPSNFPPKVTTVKVPQVNVVKGVQGKWEWKPKCPISDHVSRHTSASMTLKRFDYNDALGRSKSDMAWGTGVIASGCSRHMTGNMSCLSYFEEINGGYVAFGGNPKGGKITKKGKIRTDKLDFDDVYFVKELKFNLFSVSQMCNKKNIVLFTDTKCIILSPEFELSNENQVLLGVLRENNMYNVDLKNIILSGDLTCLFAKEPEFKGKKPDYKVHVSPNSSAKIKKHDDKTTKEAKGKSPVELSTRYRNLSVEFKDFFDNNINEINAANTSQYFDDPNMHELEDITYSDDEEDVSAEAQFTNLETTINVSPIPTTRVYKDHPVKQKPDGIFNSHDKYVAKILRKFGLTDRKSASIPIDTKKPLLKDLGVTKIFSYLKSKPHLGLWYPKDSPFNLVAYSDSDYASARLDRKSTTGGCQFHRCRLISWQCKNQTVVATSSTEAEYVAAASCYAEVLWIQNQLLDYRVGKGFSGVKTPLFEGMIVVQQADDVADEGAAGVDVDVVPAVADEPYIPSPTPTTQPPPPSQELPSTSQVIPTPPPSLIAQPSSPLQQQQPLQPTHDAKILMDLIQTLLETYEDVTLKDVAVVAKEVEVKKDDEIEENADDDELEPAELKEVVEVVTTAKLMKEVVTAAAATFTAATTLITAATITAAPNAARRRKGVVIRDPEETSTPSIIIHSKPKSKDKGKGIMVQEPKPLKKKTQIEKDEAYARELEVGLNKNINWDDVIEQVQRKKKEDNAMLRMSYDDIRSIFKKYFNSNVAFLEKTKEQMEEEGSRALKRTSESLEEKVATKQKLDEEVKELKKHLQIVPNNDDDVYTEATPLALKVPVVVYAIHTENNKPYFKIIRANGTHQLFLSFLSLLMNFDREDLEVLWQLVKERFASLKPKSFSDDFLLTTFMYMFEKPDVQAQVWKKQRNDHASREKISIDKVYFRSDAKQSLELMLLKTSKIYTKGLRLLVEDFLLPMQVDAKGLRLLVEDILLPIQVDGVERCC